MHRLLVILLFLAAPGVTGTAFAQDLSRFVQYDGKSTNQLVMDKQFQSLTRAFFGRMRDRYLKPKPMRTGDTIIEALHDPPGTVNVTANGYLTAGACRAHPCQEKAFVAMDTRDGMLAYALIHYSKDWSAKKSERYNKNGYMTIFFRKEIADEFRQFALDSIHDWQLGLGAPLSGIEPVIVYVN